MNENVKISIIIPIYNVERYLEKCIDSVLNQTFRNIEVILIDDGSTDGCGEICEHYKRLDDRIVVVHKENEGLSMARNIGIDISNGDYIGFIDSDDYIAPDMYELLYKNLLDNYADISICGLFDCYEGEKIPQCKEKEFLILNNKEALKLALEGMKFSVNAVNKLYKRELFKENKFPRGKLSEDAFTIPKILAKASRVVVDTTPKYYYVHRGCSITTSEFKIQDLNVIEAYRGNLEFVNDRFPELNKQAEFRYLWSYMYVLDKMILSEGFNQTLQYNEVASILKKGILSIVSNPFFSLKRKTAMLIFSINENIYKNMLIHQKKRVRKLMT